MHRKIFLLNWKRLLVLIIALAVAVILHNIVSGALRLEEPFFFLIATIIIPVYLFLSMVYTFAHCIAHRKMKKINMVKKKGKKRK